jgi:hypothetical protein
VVSVALVPQASATLTPDRVGLFSFNRHSTYDD